MQIKGLHKNIYRLANYACTQEYLELSRQKYQPQVQLWEKLSIEGVSLKLKQEIVGVSRATYYRHKKILKNLRKGFIPPSKRPKSLNKPRWTESHKQLVTSNQACKPNLWQRKNCHHLKTRSWANHK